MHLVNTVVEFRGGGDCEALIRSAVHDYVGALRERGMLPESMLILVKRAIASVQTTGDDRTSRRNQSAATHIVEWCIEEYYAGEGATNEP